MTGVIPGEGDELVFEIGHYRLTVAAGFGPRVLGLTRDGGADLFARLEDTVAIPSPEGGYPFRGGHRLWAAPEDPSVTYAGDGRPCRVEMSGETLTITGEADRAGLEKEVSIESRGDRLLVRHTLLNRGEGTLSVAPWSITQMRMGGRAVVPIAGREPGLSADRCLVLWPYTEMSDRRLSWYPGLLVIAGEPGPRLKIGFGPDPGSIGYLRDGYLFSKDIPEEGPGVYPDRGAVGQVFVEENFCELESVGPLARLEPGGRVSHEESWSLHPCPDLEAAARLLTRRT